MEGFDDLTESSETASEHGSSPCPNYETVLKLIEHLSLECKDSSSLLKIQDTVHSYKRVIKFKTSQCKVLREKLRATESEASGLQKALSEAGRQRLEQGQELCNLRCDVSIEDVRRLQDTASRFALKQEEEKRKNADWVSAKIKEQLREKEEQHNKEVKMKQKLELRVRELDVELKTVRNNLDKAFEERNGIERRLLQEKNARILQDEILANHLHKQRELEMAQEKISSQLQEALDQHIKPAQCAQEMQDCMQKLRLENCKLKATARKQAEKIEQLKKNLLNEMLTDDLIAKLESASSKCLRLHKENQLLQRELLSMKAIEKKCEKLRKHKKKLELEVVRLKHRMEKAMIERGQLEHYKWEIQETTKQDLVEKLKQVNLFLETQAAYEDKLEKLRHKQNASVRSQMELKIRDLESEFSKMRSQVDCNQMEMENYKQLYLEEVKIRKSLSNKLRKTDERLAEVKTKLLLERKQNRASQHSTVGTRSIVESTHRRDISNNFFIPRSVSVDNMAPTSSFWNSIETMESCKTKVLQEWEQSITRELREATAEFESGCHRTSPPEFTHM